MSNQSVSDFPNLLEMRLDLSSGEDVNAAIGQSGEAENVARETELKAMFEQADAENTRFEVQLQSTAERYGIFLLN